MNWLSGGRGTVSFASLRTHLSAFFPEITGQDLAMMMGGKKELSGADVAEILRDLPPGFDPVREAFDTVLNPSHSAGLSSEIDSHAPAADPAVLSDIFHLLDAHHGSHALTQDDLKAIVKASKPGAGAAGGNEGIDTALDLETFRGMLARGLAATDEADEGEGAKREQSGGPAS